MTLGQFLNSHRIEILLGHLINFLPDFTQGTPRREFAEIRVRQALHWWDIALEGTDNLSHRNLGRGFCQHMPSFWPAHAFHQPLFAQNHQYLVKILFGDILAARDICTFYWPLPIVSRHIQHCSEAIIALHCCHFHDWPGYLSRGRNAPSLEHSGMHQLAASSIYQEWQAVNGEISPFLRDQAARFLRG